MKSKWPLRHRVEVEFEDACTDNQRWASVDIHKKDSLPSLCRSIGYLVEATDHHLTVAQSMSRTTGHIADTMSIPRAAVKRMSRLRGGISS